MKKILAILLALATLFSLCSCSLLGKDDGETTTAQNQADSNENDGGDSQTPSAEEYGDAKVQKIGTMEAGSFIYHDNDMEGITSLDGKVDTGAVYYDVTIESNGYYLARTQEYDKPENLSCINSINLVDPNGKTLLEGYCDYKKLSDRFIAAAKAVEVTDGTDYDYYLSSGFFSMSAKEGDIKYNVDFYVYDLKTNKIIDGVKYEDDPTYEIGCFIGDFILYRDASGNRKNINANGYDVPEDATFLYDSDEAFYKTVAGSIGTVYDSDGKALFTYDEGKDYVPQDYSNGYFKARRYDGNGVYYVLLDKSGKAVTSEFTAPSGAGANLEACGNVVLFNVSKTGYNYQICDFKGKVLAETENVISSSDYSYFKNPQYYIFSGSKGDMIIVSTEGEVIFEAYADEAYERDSNNCAYKTVGEDTYYFCLKDKDFTIKADKYASEAPYLVEVDAANSLKDIIDVTTGETIISGYSGYTTRVNGADIYVCAENTDGTSDIYLVRF